MTATPPTGEVPEARSAPAPEPEPASEPPQAGQTEPSGAKANVERASALTEELIDRGAPWSSSTSWTIVLVEGIIVGVLGLVFLIKPLGGSSTTLQLAGIILLVAALITTFQIWRHNYRPDLEVISAFRAGSGVTVGLVVIVATWLASVTTSVTAALAVVVGIGFLVFGLAGIAISFVRRNVDEALPMFTLIINAVLALAGLVLMFAGAAGSDAVDGIFNLLGILLIVAGLGLAGYSYMLRQQEVNAAR